jgi:hypothetical protein
MIYNYHQTHKDTSGEGGEAEVFIDFFECFGKDGI